MWLQKKEDTYIKEVKKEMGSFGVNMSWEVELYEKHSYSELLK